MHDKNDYDREWYVLCQVSDMDLSMEGDGVEETERDIRGGRVGVYPLTRLPKECVPTDKLAGS